MFMPLLETAIAFIAAVLALALIVQALVRLIHAGVRRRQRGVAELLARLHTGFFASYGLTPRLAAWYRDNFVQDLISSPVLHAHGSDDVSVQRSAARRGKYDIEYISKDDIVRLIEQRTRNTGKLPARWHGIPEDEERPPPEELVEYVKSWYDTAAGTVSQRFGEDARRLSVALSAVVVVLLNVDAFQLVHDIYHDRTLREQLASRTGELEDVAEELGATERDDEAMRYGADPARTEDWRALRQEAEKAAAALRDQRMPIGWQDSHISQLWCAYQGCGPPGVAKPTTPELVRAVLMWLGGLLFTIILVSLGAPYWFGVLKKVVGWRNAVQARKEPDDDGANKGGKQGGSTAEPPASG